MGNIVRENIEFKRGREPKQSLNIGKKSLYSKDIQLLRKDLEDRFIQYFYKNSMYVNVSINTIDHPFYPDEDILRIEMPIISENVNPKTLKEIKKWIEDNTNFKVIDSQWAEQWLTMRILLIDLKEEIILTNEARENIEFKRGRSPRQSLGIGIEESLYDIKTDLEGVHPFQQKRLKNGDLKFHLFVETETSFLKFVRDWIENWSDEHGYEFDWTVGTTRLPKELPPEDKHLEGKMGALVSITFTNK